MATLQSASQDDVRRTLELFPVSVLKAGWGHLRGTKEELCAQIAEQADRAGVAQFIMQNFARCKQHTYVLQPRHADQASPETLLPFADAMGQVGQDTFFFLGSAVYTVLVRDPDFRQEDVSLLWPMRVQYREGATIISFIVLERDVRTFYTGDVISVRRHREERMLLEDLGMAGYQSLDLNKGIKALWASDYMDAFRSKFKKARSTTTENMDRERGIKATDAALYELMQGLPLFDTSFRIAPASGSPVEIFQVNPTDGTIRMTRYTEGGGDSDELVDRILEANI